MNYSDRVNDSESSNIDVSKLIQTSDEFPPFSMYVFQYNSV